MARNRREGDQGVVQRIESIFGFGPPAPYDPLGSMHSPGDPKYMSLSDNGKGFIQGWEKFSPTTYNDGYGNPTIGYGHVLPRWRASPITEEEGQKLFTQDVANVQRAITNNVTAPLTQSQYDTLVSFGINSGTKPIAKIAQNINAGDYDGALARMGQYVNASGVESKGLINRREGEAALWNGTYQPPTEGLKGVQQRLAASGFDPGPIDGQMGPQTQAALDAAREAQTANARMGMPSSAAPPPSQGAANTVAGIFGPPGSMQGRFSSPGGLGPPPQAAPPAASPVAPPTPLGPPPSQPSENEMRRAEVGALATRMISENPGNAASITRQMNEAGLNVDGSPVAAQPRTQINDFRATPNGVVMPQSAAGAAQSPLSMAPPPLSGSAAALPNPTPNATANRGLGLPAQPPSAQAPLNVPMGPLTGPAGPPSPAPNVAGLGPLSPVTSQPLGPPPGVQAPLGMAPSIPRGATMMMNGLPPPNAPAVPPGAPLSGFGGVPPQARSPAPPGPLMPTAGTPPQLSSVAPPAGIIGQTPPSGQMPSFPGKEQDDIAVTNDVWSAPFSNGTPVPKPTNFSMPSLAAPGALGGPPSLTPRPVQTTSFGPPPTNIDQTLAMGKPPLPAVPLPAPTLPPPTPPPQINLAGAPKPTSRARQALQTIAHPISALTGVPTAGQVLRAGLQSNQFGPIFNPQTGQWQSGGNGFGGGFGGWGGGGYQGGQYGGWGGANIGQGIGQAYRNR